MVLHLTRLRRVSKKFVSKIKLEWLGIRILSIRRGVSGIPLSPIIAAAEFTGNLGSAVPLLQGVSLIVAAGLVRAKAVEENQKGCEELVRVTESLRSALIDAAGSLPDVELDEKTRWNLAELEGHIDAIVANMEYLRRKSAWRRFLYKDRDAAAVVENRGRLMHALKIFQTKELIAMAHAQRADNVRILHAVRIQDIKWWIVALSTVTIIMILQPPPRRLPWRVARE